jgi:hypothetical protein
MTIQKTKKGIEWILSRKVILVNQSENLESGQNQLRNLSNVGL